jgi:hypothetical protein
VKNSGTRVHAAFTATAASCAYHIGMRTSGDEPLPATLAFVFTLGALIVVGWFAMYVLLRARW